jgi:phospholipid/cholesterol/gamma-HCH transport system substrate-binding protein
MSETPTPPRRFKGIRRQSAFFILSAMLAFAGVVFLVAYKQGMFVEHTNVYFHAPDATGINQGMSVRLHGVPVGSVKEIQLAERGVRVRLGINTAFVTRIPSSSQAKLIREGVVGAASIQILTAAPAGAERIMVAEGDVIRFIPQRTMNEMFDEVRQQLTPAFQELRKVASEMSDPDSDFRRSVSATREVIEELPEMSRELRQLLRDTDRTMVTLGRQAETVGKQVSQTLGIVTRLGQQTDEHLPVLAGKLATTLDSLNATSAQVRETTRANGEALREILASTPELMRGGNELVRDSQEIAAAARRTWFLRDYVEAPGMRTLPVDSFESFGKR